MTADYMDMRLVDSALLAEVHLVAELMIGASEFDGPLDKHEIDRLLGLNDPMPRQQSRRA